MDLKNKLIELDGKIFDFYVKNLKEMHVPSAENINAIIEEIGKLRKEVLEVKEYICEDDVENIVWAQHLIELLDCWEIGIKENTRHPSKYLRGIGFRIAKILEDEKKSIIEKAEKINGLSTKILEILSAVYELCLKVSDEKIIRTIKCANGLKRDIDRYIKIIEEMILEKEEERKAKQQIIEKLSIMRNSVEEFELKVKGIIGEKREIVDEIPYETLMEKHYRIPIKWVLSWYKEELENAKKRFYEMASKFDPNKNPLQVLREKIHIPYESPEEMFKDMERFLEIAKENAKKYLDFPDEVTCKVVGVKEFEKDVYPMGHAGGPDPLEGGLESYVALNQYNYKAFSKGWLMMMAIHEAYYGHNIHSIKIGLANIPKTFKIGSGIATPISEGLAHRGEELLQHIYGDEAFPLLVAWRRMQTTLRIYIDIGLFCTKTITPNDAVKLYMDVMGFDEQTSRGLVEWHLENRGYNVCYFTGYKMIEELRKYTSMSEKDFSNTLFSAGFISISNAKRLLKIKDKMPWE
ncbi:MAG: DUF885 family protein [Candidatus Methanomethylicia archaeon]